MTLILDVSWGSRNTDYLVSYHFLLGFSFLSSNTLVHTHPLAFQLSKKSLIKKIFGYLLLTLSSCSSFILCQFIYNFLEKLLYYAVVILRKKWSKTHVFFFSDIFNRKSHFLNMQGRLGFPSWLGLSAK